MRITNGSDQVFDKLVTGKEKYLFNPIYGCREKHRCQIPAQAAGNELAGDG